MTSARTDLSRLSVPSSSAPIRREYPATSAANIAATRRSVRTRPPVCIGPLQNVEASFGFELSASSISWSGLVAEALWSILQTSQAGNSFKKRSIEQEAIYRERSYLSRRRAFEPRRARPALALVRARFSHRASE